MHTTLASGERLVLGSLVTDETVAKRRQFRLRQEAALWRLTDKGVSIDEVIDLIEASRKAGPFKGRTMRQEAIDRYTAVYGS